MAKIEDLIDRIADKTLQKDIGKEIAILKKRKKFGLVFEEHIPEITQLPDYPLRSGEQVVKRGGNFRETFTISNICSDGRVHIRSLGNDKREEIVERDELHVIKKFGEPIFPTLESIAKVTRSAGKPSHVLIKAENYHALRLLDYCYAGMIDVIYIDPPYNTGSKSWKYNNDFVDSVDQWRHSKWLSMMKRRLHLARRLLKPDGVMIITIDENEVYHLGLLLESVFPDYKRSMVTIVINPKGAGLKNFARVDEYAFYCVPDLGERSLVKGNLVPFLSTKEDYSSDEVDEELEEDIELDEDSIPDEDSERKIPDDFPFAPEEYPLWERRHARRRGSESSYRHQRPNQFYPLYLDLEIKEIVKVGESIPLSESPSFEKIDGLLPIWPIDNEGNERCWRFVPASMRILVNEHRVVLGKYNSETGNWTVNIWERKPQDKKVKTVWWNPRHDAGTHGSSLLAKILGNRAAFPFPKSVYAVRDALATVCGERKDAVILDFFAGSGTTYHATALLNAEDGGHRRCILVTNNEIGEQEEKRLRKQGYRPGDDDFEKQGICESVTWPRCKYVTQGFRDDKSRLTGQYLDNENKKGKKLSDGFDENLEYFKIDFLNPDEVAHGDRLNELIPVLWLIAGAKGPFNPGSISITDGYYFSAQSPFAVLVQEEQFPQFLKELRLRDDITHIFLVTYSEDSFNEMCANLPKSVKKIRLYRSYLDHFNTNTEQSL